MTTADKLTDLISEMVREKTFSLEAVQAIEQIRSRASELEARLAAANDALASKDKQIAKYAAEESERSADRERLKTQLVALAEREKKITELERGTAVAQAEARVLDRCLDRLLGNRIIRETLTSSVPIARQYSGGGGDFVEHHTKTDTVTREQG